MYIILVDWGTMRNEIKYKIQCMEENRILKTNPKHSNFKSEALLQENVTHILNN